MGDLIGIAAIAIIYLCVVTGVGKKRRAKQQNKAAPPRRSGGKRKQERQPSFETAFDSSAQAKTKQPAVRQTAARAPGTLAARAEAPVGEDCGEAVHAPGLHLHEVTQAQMMSAGEGEDPCHAGGAERSVSQRESILGELETAADNEAARELLRGVILSEILERPCERRARRLNRRRI